MVPIDLIFGCINLAVVFGIIVFLFRRIGVPLAHQAIEEQKGHIVSLQDRRLEAVREQRIVANEAQVQAELCVDMNQKVSVWNAVQERAQNLVLEQRQKTAKELIKIQEQQQKSYQESKIERELAPRIYGRLEKELQDYFTSDTQNEQYYSDLFKRIKSNT